MKRFLIFTTVLVVVFSMFTGSVVAEDPHNQDCEGVVLVAVLCAGADAGANGDCTNTAPAEVSCWYTYGWNLNVSSPVQLPGGGVLEWSFEVTACLDGEGCSVLESGGGLIECSWIINEVQPCMEQDVDGGEADFVLALGQCVTVTASVVVSSKGWSLEEEDPLFQVNAEQQSAHGGAACYLDDGRD